MIKNINGTILRKMILNGAKLLDSNKQHVDSLNVFPVPDGDTGTNMSLTMLSAAKEVAACPNNDISVLCTAMSKGALSGARGNSGVITSQILKGISNILKDVDGDINVKQFAEAMDMGAQIAYKAVSKPQEGTILTVIRAMGDHSMKLSKRNMSINDFLLQILKVGEETLKQTPEMLPVLKKAGVVDAGGRGLLLIFQGFYNVLIGEEEVNIDFDDNISTKNTGSGYDQYHVDLQSLDDIEFAYCTEFFVINLKDNVGEEDYENFKTKLLAIGDCVLVIGDEDMIKVHVHTNTPGIALSYAIELGELDKVKIENMLEQNRVLLDNTLVEEDREFGMVSVCSGIGFSRMFKDLLVDEIVSGGQTMNPSAEDIAKTCERVPAGDVFVFPNNKNIILAAEQAKEICSKNIHVVPTVDVPQGIAAVLSFDQEEDIETNMENMLEAMTTVKVGSVTFASRDTVMDDLEIKKNDIIGLGEKKILVNGRKIDEVTLSLIEHFVDEDISSITLYYGEDVKERDAEKLRSVVEKRYPDCDVTMYLGGQAVYYYIISVE